MSNEIYKRSFNSTITKIQSDDDRVTISLSNGLDITITSEHDQDCCEHVYADFSDLDLYIPELLGRELEEFVIKAVPDTGILLCFNNVKAFIGCHNEQNGYYGDNLTLNINYDGSDTKIDVSDFVEDNIN
jgi:hypothetical protein